MIKAKVSPAFCSWHIQNGWKLFVHLLVMIDSSHLSVEQGVPTHYTVGPRDIPSMRARFSKITAATFDTQTVIHRINNKKAEVPRKLSRKVLIWPRSGLHAQLPNSAGNLTHFLQGDQSWQGPPGIFL